jgi:hypothetical protein
MISVLMNVEKSCPVLYYVLYEDDFAKQVKTWLAAVRYFDSNKTLDLLKSRSLCYNTNTYYGLS